MLHPFHLTVPTLSDAFGLARVFLFVWQHTAWVDGLQEIRRCRSVLPRDTYGRSVAWVQAQIAMCRFETAFALDKRRR
jgi:hypothetical protein